QRPQITTTVDGGTFTNRYLTLDLRDPHGLFIALSAGSGAKKDAAGGQPAVRYYTDVVKHVRPSLLVCTHTSRLGRVSWGLAPLAQALEDDGCHLLTQTSGPAPVEGTNGLL